MSDVAGQKLHVPVQGITQEDRELMRKRYFETAFDRLKIQQGCDAQLVRGAMLLKERGLI